jgi:cytosine/uracil/thiamine/allantoin permease
MNDCLTYLGLSILSILSTAWIASLILAILYTAGGEMCKSGGIIHPCSEGYVPCWIIFGIVNMIFVISGICYCCRNTIKNIFVKKCSRN